MPWYSVFLLPLSFLFRLVTACRNFLFDKGVLNSYASPIPTLVVGNLSVGGTGKTPMVEFLVKNLKEDITLATLSRGYGRKTKGFIQATADSTADQLGDEPLQIFRKFGAEVPVFVGEDRVEALHQIHRKSNKAGLVVLDDAFQHRRLSPDLKILLTPFSKPFFKDHLLPAGRLRESRRGAQRADLVVVTKCPDDLSEAKKAEYRDQIIRYSSRGVSICFSSIGYGQPYPVVGSVKEVNAPVILVSGLADDRLFVEHCQGCLIVLDRFSFGDHHAYTEQDAQKIKQAVSRFSSEKPVILTTEKDADKLKFLAEQGLLEEIPIFALPIQVVFAPYEQESLLRHIREKFNIR
jgi:tetraacyldisaccharide 4'-kinase